MSACKKNLNLFFFLRQHPFAHILFLFDELDSNFQFFTLTHAHSSGASVRYLKILHTVARISGAYPKYFIIIDHFIERVSSLPCYCFLFRNNPLTLGTLLPYFFY